MLTSSEPRPLLLLQRYRVENFPILTVIHFFYNIFAE